MVNINLLPYLLTILFSVILPLHGYGYGYNMHFNPYYYYGRKFDSDELSTLLNKLQVGDAKWNRPTIETSLKPPLPLANNAILGIGSRGPRIVRSMDSMDSTARNGEQMNKAVKSNQNECVELSTTTKPPFGLFLNIGGDNDWVKSFSNSNKKNFEENQENENMTKDPSDYYPQSTPKYEAPFDSSGFNYGNPHHHHNPFYHSGRNNKGHNCFKPNEEKEEDDNDNNENNENPFFRGGMVFGAPPHFRNPFLPNIDNAKKKTDLAKGGKSKAKFWCTKYRSRCNSKQDFGSDLKTRIIGGNPASPRDHTHMAMIGYGGPDDKHWLCGGSLISARHVLSAAHCTKTGKWGKARWVRLGDLDLSSKTEDASPQERIIVERINHPEYREPAVYHDIAIYVLDNDVTLTDWVSPICLHTTKEISPTQVTVTGWGRTDFVSDTSPVLMEVDIGIYNDTECKQLMDENGGNKLPRGVDVRIMVCAGVSQGGKDACSGDSGGPLIIETSKCNKEQIGITSVGRECGLPNSPGIYTRISHYVPWIETIVWNSWND